MQSQPTGTSGSAVTAGTAGNNVAFDSVKIFSATLHRDREVLGEVVRDWIAARPQASVTDYVVRQSSDATHHCLTIVLFYRMT